jgi:hypothetical protein
MKAITTDLEESQIEHLDTLSTARISRAEHIRRALDIYLSLPANVEALKAAELKDSGV